MSELELDYNDSGEMKVLGMDDVFGEEDVLIIDVASGKVNESLKVKDTLTDKVSDETYVINVLSVNEEENQKLVDETQKELKESHKKEFELEAEGSDGDGEDIDGVGADIDGDGEECDEDRADFDGRGTRTG